MKQDDPIVIVVASDNHYLILLAALLKSIEINHHSSEPILVYIVEDAVTPKNKKKLSDSIDQRKTTIVWITNEQAVPEGMKIPSDRSSYPMNIYMRLFIPYFIPKEFNKVLYLDVDMIMLEEISKLWNVDIENNILAAVLDPIVKTFGNGGIVNYKELGLDANSKYFNTGLLLMNLKKWRESEITLKTIECINRNQKYAKYPDQYGLNVESADQWVELDPLWNHFATKKHDKPFLIHYIRRKPIYKSYNSQVNYKKIFYEYLELTEWRNARPISEFDRYLKKASNITQKIFHRVGVKSV